uniref:UvrD-helicase domain-containing protein n=1 Tax=Methylomonas sp. SPW-1 TaxID=3438877 RepID=UPI00402BDF8D
MDAIELARQRAAELHNAVVQRGHDPWLAYEFVVVEAEERGYVVEGAVPGAEILDGGRAKLLKDLILHELNGTSFEQALLVAHELGHALLGDAEDATPAKEVDFARSAEPSPVGEDRVVDYSRKQRREIQMDLFAREFLLPRPYLRKLHLEDSLTAEAISKKLDAPYAIVAQQLLDALLLPAVILEGEEHKERPLNKQQKTAAEHRGFPYLLEAGPGTGKTQTLVARVDGLLNEGVDPRRILLLTFSNKAAGEMAERIARKQPKAATALWIGTFHAYGLDIVRRFHQKFGMPKEPRMLDRTEAVELIEHEFPSLALKHYRNLYDPTQNISEILIAISRAKDEVVGPERYSCLANMMLDAAQNDDEREAAEKAIELAQVYAIYEKLKQEHNCVDFGDLVYLPVQLLEGNREVREHLAVSYDHILVDEYQDVNRSSVRLLQALCPQGNNLWVVGDAKQSIYRFRGASSFNVSRFGIEDFPGGQRGQLELNYRSLRPIVQAFSSFAINMRSGGAGNSLQPNRNEVGTPPELRITTKADEQAVAIADCIEEFKRLGISYQNQAVLCTGNDKLAELASNLEAMDIPVLFLGSLFERPEVKNLLSFLSLMLDARAMGLVRVACLPDFQMEIQDVAAVLGHLRSSKAEALSFLENREAINGLSPSGHDALGKLKILFSGLNATDIPWIVLATILLDRTSLAADIAKSDSIASRAEGIAIWQFMNFAKSQPGGNGLPISRLLERIRRLLRLSDDKDLRQLPAAASSIDAVRLMTIHGAKGLEFQAIHILGLNEDTIPGRRRRPPMCLPPDGMIQGADGTVADFLDQSRAEEQECLFYVALSRARDRLVLYACTKDGANRNRRLSEGFISRLGGDLIKLNIVPTRTLPPTFGDKPITLDLTGPLQLSEHQIELFERCPRRFLYTHILQTGGRRTATPFLQMHDGVRTLMKRMIAEEVTSSDDELVAEVEAALRSQGLSDHGYFENYREFAVTMIQYFAASRSGFAPQKPIALRVEFGPEELVVTPDDVLLAADGSVRVRRIMTGHCRSDSVDSIGAAALLTAASQAFPTATAELVYLADQQSETIGFTAKKIGNRHTTIGEHLKAIRNGHFPARSSSFSCPQCPALFVCGPVPLGKLQPQIRPV